MNDNIARLPRKLYKYKSFGVNTLRMLGEGEIYFAQPAQFNDPFDCSPTVFNDVEVEELERLWRRLQMNDATKNELAKRLNHHRYMAIEFGSYDDGDLGTRTYSNFLVDDIDEHVKAHFAGRGVLSSRHAGTIP